MIDPWYVAAALALAWIVTLIRREPRVAVNVTINQDSYMESGDDDEDGDDGDRRAPWRSSLRSSDN